MLTPADIKNRTIKTTMGGYNKKDTDEFIASILESFEELNNENKKYRQILISQYHFCNKHIKEIQERALKTYEKSTKNNFFKKICCDFKTLEEKSKDYCKSKCE